METYLFYVFSFLTIGFSLMVVFARNPITSALSLVASFFCVSAIFILMHASFLGVMQILIYAGAILVLFLFVLMLLNLQDENWIFSHAWNYRHLLQASSLTILLAFIVLRVLHIEPMDSSELDASFGGIKDVAEELLGRHFLAFEWVSVLLFAGILGVIGIASKPRGLPGKDKEDA